MRLKQAMRYRVHEFAKPTVIFYCVMVALFVVVWLLNLIITGQSGGAHTTMDTTAIIFLFVLGLNSFKNPFKMYLQNGISRRTQLVSFAVTALGFALFTSLVDGILLPLVINNTIGGISSTYASIYQPSGDFMSRLTGILWNLFAYYAAFCFGFFLTTMFYRMNKPAKVLVSVGVPLLFFVILPMIEVFVPSFNLFTSILRFFSWTLGIEINLSTLIGFGTSSAVNVFPMRAVASFAVFSVLMLGATYLLMRRATLKDS